MDIYVKANKKVSIYNRTSIKIKDVAEVFAPKDVLNDILNLPVVHVNDNKPQNILISIIDVIKKIDTSFPGNTINSVGEKEVLVYFEKKQKKENIYFKWIKIIAVCIILLAGSSTAIMSFHTDAQIPTIFKNFYYIFFNETTENMALIDIPYSIGLAVGILVFFSHFSGKKEVSDPTPIEVEMISYEEEVTKTIVDKMSTEQTTTGKME